MSEKPGPDILLKTIDRAIEQARDLGRPMTTHILMMARIDLEEARSCRMEMSCEKALT